jgi:hypothetical protein
MLSVVSVAVLSPECRTKWWHRDSWCIFWECDKVQFFGNENNTSKLHSQGSRRVDWFWEWVLPFSSESFVCPSAVQKHTDYDIQNCSLLFCMGMNRVNSFFFLLPKAKPRLAAPRATINLITAHFNNIKYLWQQTSCHFCEVQPSKYLMPTFWHYPPYLATVDNFLGCLVGSASPGCETWPCTLREEHRLRILENRVLRRIFWLKSEALRLENISLWGIHHLYLCQGQSRRGEEIGEVSVICGRDVKLIYKSWPETWNEETF